MNKKLLATAVGVALAGSMAVAQADVTLFGNVNISIDSWDNDGGGDDVNMESNTSSLGVKGKEALGNGVSAIFLVDFQFEADGDASGVSSRDQWVGLSGDFGKLRMGTISTSYKSHGAQIDPLYRLSLQGRSHGMQSNLHSGRGEEGQGRATQTVRYDSPDMNGFGVTGHYTFDNSEGDGEDDDPYGIGAHYKWNGLYVFADYITTDAGGDDEAWKVGGKYDLGNGVALYGQYEGDDGLVDLDGVAGGDLWHLGASVTVGNTLVYLGLAQRDDNDLKIGEYDAWTLAVDHRLSKRTDAYAGFNQIDCDDSSSSACAGVSPDGEKDFFSVGLRHKF